MIKTAIGGIVKDVSQAKVRVAGATRNLTKGYCGVSGAVRQFFGNLTGISYFKMQFYDVRYSSLSNTTYVTLTNPTSFGVTTYSTSPNSVKVECYENGNVSIIAGTSMRIYVRVRLYCILSNGASIPINNMYKNSSSVITISGESSATRVGSGSMNATTQCLSNYTSTTDPWSVSSLGASSPYFLNIMAQDLSGTNTSCTVSFKNLDISVDGVFYSIKLVL